MPELPEVETARRGLEPHLVGRTVHDVEVRERRLRYPVPAKLGEKIKRRRLQNITRRGKYLLFHFANGVLIAHLGMSGSLRVVSGRLPPDKHEHLDIVFSGDKCLRYRDVRKFGLFLWSESHVKGGHVKGDVMAHRLLANLGVEPLSPEFDGAYLHKAAQGRQTPVKNLIMNSRVVVGVGNIYASEALFLAKINPARSAGRIGRQRYDVLAGAIGEVLRKAIKKGGTTLRDFVREDGEPGYFSLSLNVYGREGEACVNCARPIKRRTLGQRSSFYCAYCQR